MRREKKQNAFAVLGPVCPRWRTNEWIPHARGKKITITASTPYASWVPQLTTTKTIAKNWHPNQHCYVGSTHWQVNFLPVHSHINYYFICSTLIHLRVHLLLWTSSFRRSQSLFRWKTIMNAFFYFFFISMLTWEMFLKFKSQPHLWRCW